MEAIVEMPNMPLVNIGNVGREIYLFCRNPQTGRLNITSDNTFLPYFYEIDANGKYLAEDGTKLRKIYVSHPADVAKTRTLTSYSSDIPITTNYIIQKIGEITPTRIKYMFLDIEVLCDDLSDIEKGKYPISCISVYNNYDDKIETQFLPEQAGISLKEQETNLLNWLVAYIKRVQPDIWLSWNVEFDYNIIHRRYGYFSKAISPIKNSMRGSEKDIFFPIGLSVVDYLKLFKKVYMREASYTLDYVGEKYLKAGKEYKYVDFSKLTETIKKRNRGDVEMLVNLEKKFKLIPYYDEIRRITKVSWTDLYFNSRLVDSMLQQEAKKKSVVLPNKPLKEENDEEESFQGAFREVFQQGLFNDVSVFDLSSAYPTACLDYNLDANNISVKEGLDINGIKFIQNSNALLPTIVKNILILKDQYKKLSKEQPTEDNKIKYAAIKAITNSYFGVCGNKYSRIYNLSVASTITFLIRDVLHYVKEHIEAEGYKVLYIDTDSVMITTPENIATKLNDLVKQWAKEKYNKTNTILSFEYQGKFNRLYLSSKCRYIGYLEGHIEPEIKGLEMKRAGTSKFEAQFQRNLLDKILNKDSKEDITNWIYSEIEIMKKSSLFDIGFPVKIGTKDYVNLPIFVRAADNTKKIEPKFKPRKGELFWYVYVQNNNVLAFNEQYHQHVVPSIVDWETMIARCIYAKAEPIFETMNWYFNKNKNQQRLF